MLRSFVSVLLALTAVFSAIRSLTSRPTAPVGGEVIKYGSAYNQCLDIFMPDKVGDTADVVLTIHGGTWSYGDQHQFDKYAQMAAEYGYIGVSLDHRKLTDNVRIDGMLGDIQSAVTAVKQYMEKKGIAAGKMIVAGHSSGAHLALLYSYKHYEDSPIPIAFVTAVSAPCDMELFIKGSTTLRNNYYLLTALADEEISEITIGTAQGSAALAKINPIDFVTPDGPERQR